MVDVTLANQIEALLGVLALFALSVEPAIEMVKPWLFMYLPKDEEGNVEPNLYLAIIRFARVVVGFVFLALFGGYPLLVSIAPWLGTLPEFVPDLAVIIVCSFILGLGADVIHSLKDLVRAAIDRLSPPAIVNVIVEDREETDALPA